MYGHVSGNVAWVLLLAMISATPASAAPRAMPTIEGSESVCSEVSNLMQCYRQPSCSWIHGRCMSEVAPSPTRVPTRAPTNPMVDPGSDCYEWTNEEICSIIPRCTWINRRCISTFATPTKLPTRIPTRNPAPAPTQVCRPPPHPRPPPPVLVKYRI